MENKDGLKEIGMSYVIRFVFMMVLATSGVFATAIDIPIIKGTVDDDDRRINLILNVDKNFDITTLSVAVADSVNGESVDQYDIEKMFAGFVLYSEGSRDIVTLQSDQFSPHQGGEVTLSYLYNGITGTIRSVVIDVYRDGDEWKVSQAGAKFGSIHLVKNKKPFIGVIGIKNIEFQ